MLEEVREARTPLGFGPETDAVVHRDADRGTHGIRCQQYPQTIVQYQAAQLSSDHPGEHRPGQVPTQRETLTDCGHCPHAANSIAIAAPAGKWFSHGRRTRLRKSPIRPPFDSAITQRESS
ncbi:hypothetical protein GCM10023323_14370 [Streptomyces thinghirensis]|uniref:Uncharacterized protein n=1 Tax=Streptomyces thinghirensis TaxID=551547 RepID=A0ABP9T0F3_9ACTN